MPPFSAAQDITTGKLSVMKQDAVFKFRQITSWDIWCSDVKFYVTALSI